VLIAVTGSRPNLSLGRRRALAFEALAKACDSYDMKLILTTPAAYLKSDRAVAGWKLLGRGTSREWKSVNLSVTERVIYDAMYLADLKMQPLHYRSFRKQVAKSSYAYFNPVLPAKDKLYRQLTLAKLKHGRLPQTQYDVTERDVLRLLDDVGEVWFKPTYGSGGRNMAFIERLGKDKFRVHAERFFGEVIHREMTVVQLRRLIRRGRQHRVYMAQHNIPLLQTEMREKVDFRVTLGRDNHGTWDVTGLTLRSGAPSSSVTNYHAGGTVQSLTEWTDKAQGVLDSLGVELAQLERMQLFGVEVAEGLTRHYPRLGLLGVDIGLTQNGDLFVYDCNGRPGRDILTDAEVRHVMRRVAGFACYLGS